MPLQLIMPPAWMLTLPDAAQLIPMIREDLASSPFREEGHRKVYYRLKLEKHIKVAAKRILRLIAKWLKVG